MTRSATRPTAGSTHRPTARATTSRPALALAAALSAVVLGVAGCDSSQSGGSSNPDNQSTQPPLPTGGTGTGPSPAAS